MKTLAILKLFEATGLSIYYLHQFLCPIYIHTYIHILMYIQIIVPDDSIMLWNFKCYNSQGQEKFLAPSADKQTHNQETEFSKHHPFLSTLRSKELSHSKTKWWVIYTNLPVNAKARLPHPRSGDSRGQETFLVPSAGNQTCDHHDTECSNHDPSLFALRSKRLS